MERFEGEGSGEAVADFKNVSAGAGGKGVGKGKVLILKRGGDWLGWEGWCMMALTMGARSISTEWINDAASTVMINKDFAMILATGDRCFSTRYLNLTLMRLIKS